MLGPLGESIINNWYRYRPGSFARSKGHRADRVQIIAARRCSSCKTIAGIRTRCVTGRVSDTRHTGSAAEPGNRYSGASLPLVNDILSSAQLNTVCRRRRLKLTTDLAVDEVVRMNVRVPESVLKIR